MRPGNPHTEPSSARRAALEAELRKELERAGSTDQAIRSVMSAGCRVDGVGAGAVSDALAAAGRRVRERAVELAQALDRMDDGSYGRCARCGAEISAGRLDLVPTTTRCRRCAD